MAVFYYSLIGMYFALGVIGSLCACASSWIILSPNESIIGRLSLTAIIAVIITAVFGLVFPPTLLFIAAYVLPCLAMSGLGFWLLNQLRGWSFRQGLNEASATPRYFRFSIRSLLWTTAMLSAWACAWILLTQRYSSNPVALWIAFVLLFGFGVIIPHVAYSLVTTHGFSLMPALAVSTAGAAGFLSVARLIAPRDAGPGFGFSDADKWALATSFTFGCLLVQASYLGTLRGLWIRLQTGLEGPPTPVEAKST